ncbi:transposase [Streptomyces sp. ISL-96]|uniref:transposase n=1 Tax=Streptomyces sp. ISL-96 TaxID=2819191 RepID=UPI0035AB9749
MSTPRALPAQGPALQAGQLSQGRLVPPPAPGIRLPRPTTVWRGRFWSGSYFAGSCSGAPLTLVRQYVEDPQRPT